MPTPIGTNTITSIIDRYLMNEVVDNVYGSNPLFFRLHKANKRMVQGGRQIEVPLLYARFTNGGAYSDLDVLTVAPQDTIKNAAFDWKQYYTSLAFSGKTLALVDNPQALVNLVQFQMQQAEMELCELLASGLWNTGADPKAITGLQAAVDDGTLAASYGGILRSANTWWQARRDTTATMTLAALQTAFGAVTQGGQSPTIIVSGQDQYNRFWALNVVNQDYPTSPGGHDEQLASAGFHNQLFNGTPWVVDSHVPIASGANTQVFLLNENFLHLIVNPRADFYMEPFQTPVNQDAVAAKLFWMGEFAVSNCARQARFVGITA